MNPIGRIRKKISLNNHKHLKRTQNLQNTTAAFPDSGCAYEVTTELLRKYRSFKKKLNNSPFLLGKAR